MFFQFYSIIYKYIETFSTFSHIKYNKLFYQVYCNIRLLITGNGNWQSMLKILPRNGNVLSTGVCYFPLYSCALAGNLQIYRRLLQQKISILLISSIGYSFRRYLPIIYFNSVKSLDLVGSFIGSFLEITLWPICSCNNTIMSPFYQNQGFFGWFPIAIA